MEPIENGDSRATSSELELRRQRVLQLRLRQMTVTAIATAIGVDASTVSRDLQWIYANWRERYGLRPTMDPAEEVGQALALYEDIESLALLEHTNLNREIGVRRISPMFAARQRMACLRTAGWARQMRMNLLQDLGIVERALGTLTVRLPRASEIRAALRAAEIPEGMLVSEAERQRHTPGEERPS